MRPGMKAGLVGAIVVVMCTTVGQLATSLPEGLGLVATCCSCAPLFLVYPTIGALAAHWETPPRSPEQGAGAGGLAGLVAGSEHSVLSATISLALALSGGGSQQYLRQLPPEQIEALRGTGLIDLFGTRGQVGTIFCLTFVCLIAYIVVAEVGGAIYGAARRGVGPEPTPAPAP
mgnify:CR=1 FL=1